MPCTATGGIDRSTDNGVSWQSICGTYDDCVGIDIAFGAGFGIYGTDTPYQQNYIERINLSSRQTTRVLQLPRVSYSAYALSPTQFLVGTVRESGAPAGDGQVHLYASDDGGQSFTDVYASSFPSSDTGPDYLQVQFSYPNGDFPIQGGSGTVVAHLSTSAPSPPSNTVLPVVSGVAQQGQTLTASTGSWTGSPTSFGYRWRDCDASGNSCADIAGATGSSYLLQAADVGHTLRVVVTASNASGSAAATSAPTGTVAVAGGAPVNSVLPVVSGVALQGQTLTASNGSWTGSPTSFAYRWRDCDSAGSSCVDIAGATASSYLLQAGDVAHTVRVVVTATNASGSAAATSAQTVTVAAAGGSWSVGSSIAAGQTLAGQLAWTATVAGITTGQIQSVDFYIDGVLSWTEHLSPYFFNGDGNTLDTTTLANGSHTFTVLATANDGTTATSQTTDTTSNNGVPPANTVLPSVSGTAQLGQTLTVANGSWSGSPTSFAYRWRDCDASGSSCVDIAGATGSTYLLVAADVGHTLRVVVTATNAGGSTAATSAQTAVVLGAPPANTVLPSVSGTAQLGQTLTAANGSWTGSPTSFAYRWRDCDASGNACVDIAGATGSTYLLVAADVGSTLRVVVTATNAGGSTAATSTQTGTVAAAGSAPANTVLPAVSGVAQQGQTLTASNGSWTGSPTSFAYVWRDCDASGGNCVDIAGATGSSYVLQSADVGHTVRAVVTATNAGGTTPATSTPTALVLGAPPGNTVLPSVSGTAQLGQTLTASVGQWTGSPTSFGYRWRDCDTAGSNCVDVAGATAATYVLQASDVGSSYPGRRHRDQRRRLDRGDLAADRCGCGPASDEHWPADDRRDASAGTDAGGVNRELDGQSDLVRVSLARLRHRREQLCRHRGRDRRDLRAADVGRRLHASRRCDRHERGRPDRGYLAADLGGDSCCGGACEYGAPLDLRDRSARADPDRVDRQLDGESDLVRIPLAWLRHGREQLYRDPGGDGSGVPGAAW